MKVDIDLLLLQPTEQTLLGLGYSWSQDGPKDGAAIHV